MPEIAGNVGYRLISVGGPNNPKFWETYSVPPILFWGAPIIRSFGAYKIFCGF